SLENMTSFVVHGYQILLPSSSRLAAWLEATWHALHRLPQCDAAVSARLYASVRRRILRWQAMRWLSLWRGQRRSRVYTPR
ncbi:MAG: hypothetical protein C4345_02600, partial [Chloroflexota bacterium]